MIYLSQNLRFLRKALHFPQWQVALWLNVERSSYTYYETGHTMPPLLILLKLYCSSSRGSSRSPWTASS